MQGMSMKSLKKHPALIPLYGVIGVGMFLAAYYVTRIYTIHPEVGWTKESKPHMRYDNNRQYKFYAPTPYKDLPASERPRF